MPSTRGSKRTVERPLPVSKNSSDDDNDSDGAPEEVMGHDEETQRLRELHEKTALPKEKRRKISSATTEVSKGKKKTSIVPKEEDLIDPSILEVASAVDFTSAKANKTRENNDETFNDLNIVHRNSSNSKKLYDALILFCKRIHPISNYFLI
jgi:hypothetical protein